MWILENIEKKNVTQVEKWINGDGDSFTISIGWRWGKVRFKDKPNLDDYDPDSDSINIYSIGDVEDMDLDDGCWEEWEFSEGVSEEDQELIQEKYNDGDMSELEEQGWYSDDYDVYFAGPLELTEKE